MLIHRVLVASLVGALLSSCTTQHAPDPEAATPSASPGSSADVSARLAPLDLATSLSRSGLAWAADTQRARYDLRASADPVTGRVEGDLLARIPAGELTTLRFRFLAGLDSMRASPEFGTVTVDGQPVGAHADQTLVEVPLPSGHGPDTVVQVPFRYTLPKAKEPASGLSGLAGGLSGDLDPAEIGLLSRHQDAMNLGHWFPLWIPPGRSADPELDGFGDLGNFDAADISLRLTVPSGWDVVDSGVDGKPTLDAQGGTLVTSQGAAMRDFSVAIVKGWTTKARQLHGRLVGTTLTATAPADQADELDTVLNETEDSLQLLSRAFGEYPWREFDVVAAPLAASVGGMEWPGGTWVEENVLAGGIPGLGRLDLDSLAPGVLDGLGLGNVVTALRTARPWTLAHEAAHSWWTLLVGNDSIRSPIADEPLAQFSACLVIRHTERHPGRVCQAQMGDTYLQSRALGVPDGVADQPSDEFASGLQYGALVYGKAAAFWLELERTFGRTRVLAALRDVVAAHAFGTVDGPALRAALVHRLGRPAGKLWDRWMEQVHGDADLGHHP